ncbi:hypothetical protein GCM10010359_21860 [Streptomyces morookaense]|nr:hypothetical protein GCM10010359_21860 [Streptomyces morookaense]
MYFSPGSCEVFHVGWIDWYTNWVFVVWSLVKVMVRVTVEPGVADALSAAMAMAGAGAAEAGWARPAPRAAARTADRPKRLSRVEFMAVERRKARAA